MSEISMDKITAFIVHVINRASVFLFGFFVGMCFLGWFVYIHKNEYQSGFNAAQTLYMTQGKVIRVDMKDERGK